MTKVVSLEQSVDKALSAIMAGMEPVSAELVAKPTTACCQPKALSHGQGSERICTCHVCQPANSEKLAFHNTDSDSDYTMSEVETVACGMVILADSRESTWQLETRKNQQSHT